MGLSIIAAAPDYDQQLKMFNQMGAFNYITPGQWVGENSMAGLGLGEDNAQQFSQGVNTLTNAFHDVYSTIQANKKNKSKSSKPSPLAAGGPAAMSFNQPSSGGGIPSWVLWGGGILVAGLLLYMLLKKKKRGGDDRDYRPAPSAEAKEV